MKPIKKIILTILISLFAFTEVYSATFFSGYAGGKLDYAGNPSSEKYNPDLKLQAFFAGQFNFSKNIWSHIEFSLDTQDLISNNIFNKTESFFQIDEISLIFRNQGETTTKYFSTFMGTYDPIGSDIFLQRYFGLKPIASKITDSWLGLAGSILYPHFGIGISEISKINNQPLAGGFYLYMNHEDENYFVFNADLRGACTYRYFTADIAAGIGIPFVDTDPQYQGAWEKTNYHLGATILIGNNYTNALFIQAGIYNLTTSKQFDKNMPYDKTYILIEPRLLVKGMHLNVSLFSLPKNTVEKLFYIHDTLGINGNLYSDSITLFSKRFTAGVNASITFPDKYYAQLTENIFENGMLLNISPYFTTNLLSGEINTMIQIQTGKFLQKNWGNAISIDVGYKTIF